MDVYERFPLGLLEEMAGVIREEILEQKRRQALAKLRGS